MSEPIAYVDGRLLPAREAVLPVHDGGFVLGVTVAEQIRTFSGELYRLQDHLARLDRSLETIGVGCPLGSVELTEQATAVATHNHRLLAAGDDLGLCIFVTPGSYPTMAPQAAGPRLCLHTYPLPFAQWADKYSTGQSLSITSVRQVPTNCWPAELKCRSRMHYFLADQEAHRRHAGSRALLLDQHGLVSEASTANVLIYRADEGLLAPPHDKTLPGISMATVRRLASELQIPFTERDLQPTEVVEADEVLLSSTSLCLLPVTHLDGRAIAGGEPGPVFHQLLAAWSGEVGVDIAHQARRFANRP
ncbi:MAG: aminotransferase class IV [Pirellulaceae bacterium]|jgi:branched-subunit amino acid aminotransferase/4-amino-4-deoxychorismate lyase|nr:aminotransferase class IV [Pirellulaceae bacterium]MDP7014648.1 aminotransferase class IV [Pirellulaceae bacterium]